MELLDVRFSYCCRFSHTKSDGLSPIVLRIVYRNQRKDPVTVIPGKDLIIRVNGG